MEDTKSTPNDQLTNLFDGFDAAYGSKKHVPQQEEPKESEVFAEYEIIPLEEYEKHAYNKRKDSKDQGKQIPPPSIRQLTEAIERLEKADKHRANAQRTVQFDRYAILLPELELLEAIQERLERIIDKRSYNLEDQLRRES